MVAKLQHNAGRSLLLRLHQKHEAESLKVMSQDLRDTPEIAFEMLILFLPEACGKP